MDFCFELGGYPIYANNAYEWQIIQGSFFQTIIDLFLQKYILEIMLKDRNFNVDYVYTGLLSPIKSLTDAYWLPRNISVCFIIFMKIFLKKSNLLKQYNSSLNYLWFASSRGADRTGFHLSKATDESYYGLYDINPSTTLNSLRFCRKDNIKQSMKSSPSCISKHCTTAQCLNITLPSQTEDLRFGFYGCYPKNSLASIVYTHSFPRSGKLSFYLFQKKKRK